MIVFATSQYNHQQDEKNVKWSFSCSKHAANLIHKLEKESKFMRKR